MKVRKQAKVSTSDVAPTSAESSDPRSPGLPVMSLLLLGHVQSRFGQVSFVRTREVILDSYYAIALARTRLGPSRSILDLPIHAFVSLCNRLLLVLRQEQMRREREKRGPAVGICRPTPL